MYSEEKDEVLHTEEEHHHHEHNEECECEHEHHHHHHDDEECDCGHEHHHHHHDDDDEDECDCGHEHHHHHHDDEECDCGHEHHHHHHDDDEEYECDCGHEHHHHHEDGCQCEECTSGISVIHHDTALAVSFKADIDFDKDAIDKVINGAMTMLCGLVDQREGVIGHIKAAISSGDDAAMYSLTYDEVSRVGDFDKLGRVDGISYAAIVYGVEEDVLRNYMLTVKKLVEAK